MGWTYGAKRLTDSVGCLERTGVERKSYRKGNKGSSHSRKSGRDPNDNYDNTNTNDNGRDRIGEVANFE